MTCRKCYYRTEDGEEIEYNISKTEWRCPRCSTVDSVESEPASLNSELNDGLCPVVSLKDYTPIDEIKHVTYTKMEIEQTYNCETCGPLQVINGVCVHTKPDEEHGA